jgi:hypothetical protein
MVVILGLKFLYHINRRRNCFRSWLTRNSVARVRGDFNRAREKGSPPTLRLFVSFGGTHPGAVRHPSCGGGLAVPSRVTNPLHRRGGARRRGG